MSKPAMLRERSQSSAKAPAGQRRRATVLFADMEGSTPLAEQLGEEGAYDVARHVIRVLTDAVEAHGGTVQEVMGDGIMALFGAPAAIEDAPLAACRAAMKIHEGIETLSGEVATRHGVKIRVRVGLHAGSVVVGEIGKDGSGEITAIGDAVNVASRLEAMAEPGTSLLSEALYKGVGEFVETAALGERSLKGKEQPQKIYRLDGLKVDVTRFDAARARGLSRFVGREPELETLEAAWHRAKTGNVATITISGEAGVGKSRLVHEFRQKLASEGAHVLEGHCTGDRRVQPFLPMIEIVRASFRIDPGADADRVRDKLRRGLGVLEIDVDTAEPYLVNLLGFPVEDPDFQTLDDEVIGSRTRNTILAMLRARCRMSPTVMILEDLHWIDSATEGLLERIMDDKDLSQLLLVVTSRPGHAAKWSAGQPAAKIVLDRLSHALVDDLIRSRLGIGTVPQLLSDLVSEKAEGNPLFAEEILNYLLETGQATVTEGTAVLNPDAKAAVPISVENMLMDRVDRLPEETRALLEAAAVLGRTFETSLAAKIAGVSKGGGNHLATLAEQDVILARSRGRYAFKHALLRDAVYDSLLKTRREELHARAAEAIEKSKNAADAIEVLAHHWSRAQRPDKAVPALVRAGEESLRIYSLDEADKHFRDAIEFMDQHPEAANDELYVDVLLHLARILYFRAEFSGIIQLVEVNLQRVEALGDEGRLARFLFEGGYGRVFHGEGARGKEWLDRSMAIGERIDSDEARAYASLGLAWYYCWWASPSTENWPRLVELTDFAHETGRNLRDNWLASKALYTRNQGAMYYGRPGESEQFGRMLFEFSAETNDPRPRSMGLLGISILMGHQGDAEAAIDYGREALGIALSPIDRMVAAYSVSASLAMLGRTRESRQAQIGCEVLRDEFVGCKLTDPAFEGLRLIADGELSKGVASIRKAREKSDACGYFSGMSIARLAAGEAYLGLARVSERPALKVVLKNLFFLITTAPRAATLARRAFEDLHDLGERTDAPSFQALALLRLAQIDRLRGPSEASRTKLEKAQTIAREVGAESILGEIDRELARAA